MAFAPYQADETRGVEGSLGEEQPFAAVLVGLEKPPVHSARG